MQYFEDPSQLEGRRFLVDLLFKEQVFLREIFDASAESAPVLPAGSLSRIAAITATQVAGAAIYPDISSRSLQPDRPQALNFVCGWDAHTATLIIIFPTVLSIVVGIAWPTRAVLKYGADVQTSVQTGVSVASYIVTAGALLIALATWYDSVTTHEELKEEKGE
ncbi:hypothetical protein BGZ61DRAFT_100244 [Ilyonectria robusta]|uniref:uncharacterized protein n=1 Tax=Ilyonectria robusta TaxID=1079257 RepID=UPI001E8DC910|nr:uncharacterized protein BGZ61DRAFT_100244 [Ilyonectria robusta]KAH8675141.1 hypothetical protein BGZ61DRAFT_100244 [Ilyonectria robusta]